MQINRIRPLRVAALLLGGCALGFLLLMGVFLLPTGRITENLSESLWTFKQEGNYPIINRHYVGSTWDNFTDSLLLQEAAFSDSSKSLVEKAVYIYRDNCGDTGMNDLAEMVEGLTDKEVPLTYARYWHGALVWLRPLLLLFNYEDIRTLICMAQILLLGAVAAALLRRKLTGLIVPYLCMTLTLSPIGIMNSIQYFSVYVIMTLAVLAVLLWGDWLMQGARCLYFFLIVGMLTSYFDLLTYPIVTLGVPLALLLCMNRREAGLAFLFASCLAWSVGYLGLWALKWVVGSLLVGESLMGDVMVAVNLHTQGADIFENITRWTAIVRNVGVVCQPAYAVLYGGGLLACFVGMRHRRVPVSALWEGSGLLLIALLPFAWWFVTFYHAGVHSWYTYRSLAITVFAVLAWLSPARQIQR